MTKVKCCDRKRDLYFMRNFLLGVMVSVFVFSLAFLSVDAASPKLNKTKVILKIGERVTLKVRNASNVTWDPNGYSKWSDLISVSKKGVVKAKRAGIDFVSVEADGTRMSCTVIVVPNKSDLKIKKSKTSTSLTSKYFTAKLPKEWSQNPYYIIQGKNFYTFVSKTNFLSGYYGHVFSICYAKSTEWEQLSMSLPSYIYIGEKKGKVFYVTQPTDVQFNWESRKCTKEYNQLRKGLDKVFASIKLK